MLRTLQVRKNLFQFNSIRLLCWVAWPFLSLIDRHRNLSCIFFGQETCCVVNRTWMTWSARAAVRKVLTNQLFSCHPRWCVHNNGSSLTFCFSALKQSGWFLWTFVGNVLPQEFVSRLLDTTSAETNDINLTSAFRSYFLFMNLDSSVGDILALVFCILCDVYHCNDCFFFCVQKSSYDARWKKTFIHLTLFLTSEEKQNWALQL